MDRKYENEKYPIVIYYDDQRHLVCNPYSIRNLHYMALTLGIGRHWFHGGKYPHYDIPKNKLQLVAQKANHVRPRDILNIIRTGLKLT